MSRDQYFGGQMAGWLLSSPVRKEEKMGVVDNLRDKAVRQMVGKLLGEMMKRKKLALNILWDGGLYQLDVTCTRTESGMEGPEEPQVDWAGLQDRE